MSDHENNTQGGQVESVVSPPAGSHARTHYLDVDFETARSIHRIVRAMHDGECPKCHALFESRHMTTMSGDEQCPACGFTITHDEMQAATQTFAPVMERNLEVFETWRADFPSRKREACLTSGITGGLST